MNKRITFGLLLVALLGLAGASVATAHGLGGFASRRADDGRCADDMTVGDCRQVHQSARMSKLLDQCNERFDESFCVALMDMQTRHKAEWDQLSEEHGVDAPLQVWSMGHRGRPVDMHLAAASCTDDQTVKECRETRRATIDEALVAACAETYGEEFCRAWQDLRADHRAEQQALFAEYGIEEPPRHPHRSGHPGPFGRGHQYH